MSGLPENRKEMLRAGYKFLSHSTCKRCGAPVEWWQTTHGFKLSFDPPMNPNPGLHTLESAQVHKRDCRTNAPGVDARFANVQRIAEELGARFVIVFDDEGYSYANRLGLDPEDMKHELITAANEIRREMGAGR